MDKTKNPVVGNEQGQLSSLSAILNNKDVTLNCMQLLNLIDIYFGSETHGNRELDTSSHATIICCYPCVACSKQFMFEDSLNLHLERHCVLISMYCVACNKTKFFYNKCKFKYHIYSHKNQLTEPIYQNVSIQMLPVEKINSHRESKIYMKISNFILNTNGGGYAVGTPLNQNSPVNAVQITNFLTNLQSSGHRLVQCFVCNAVFETYADLKAHFNKDILETTSSANCNTCSTDIFNDIQQGLNASKKSTDQNTEFLNRFLIEKLKFSSHCSLIANINLQLNKFTCFADSPKANEVFIMQNRSTDTMVCPECGLAFPLKTVQHLYIFRVHLVNQCAYTLRHKIAKCMDTTCSFTFKHKLDLQAHWTNVHIKRLKYCDICHTSVTKYVYMNTNSDIKKHFAEYHADNLNATECIRTVYCSDYPLDPKSSRTGNNESCSFDNWKMCRQHYTHKINDYCDQPVTYCFLCNRNVASVKFNGHLQTVHETNALLTCTQCGILKESETTLDDHMARAHSIDREAVFLNECRVPIDEYLYQCFNCKLIFLFKTDFSHNCMKKELKTQTNQLNYFSPIYLKFNALSKVKGLLDFVLLAIQSSHHGRISTSEYPFEFAITQKIFFLIASRKPLN
jgi:hypothetical protein